MSRNFAFNEGGELKDLEVAEVPGLQAEGEIARDPSFQTIQSAVNPPEEMPKKNPSSQTIQSAVNLPKETPKTDSHELQAKSKVDYQQLNDPPLVQPTTQGSKIKPSSTTPNETPQEVAKEMEWANLALKQIILEENEFGFLVKEDCPKTIKEAMDSEEGSIGKWQ